MLSRGNLRTLGFEASSIGGRAWRGSNSLLKRVVRTSVVGWRALAVGAVIAGIFVATPLVGQQSPTEPPRVDADGFELPSPAVARIGTLPFQQGHGIERAEFINQGRELVVLKKDTSIAVIDMATGLERLQIDTGGDIIANGCMAVSPDGRFAAVNRSNGNLRRWRLSDGQRVASFEPNSTQGGRIAFTPDGEHLLIADTGHRRAELWNAATGDKIRQFPELSATISEMAFSRDGRLLALADERTSVQIFDVATGESLVTLPKKGLCFALAFDERGQRLAVPDAEGKISIWDATTGKMQQSLAGHTLGVVGLAFVSNDERLVSFSLDGSVRVWDLAAGKESHRFQLHAMRTGGDAFAVTPDGSLAVASSALRWIDLKTNELRPAPLRGGGPVAWSRGGDMLVTGQDALVLWNARSGQVERTITPPRPGLLLASALIGNDTAIVGVSTSGGVYRFERSTGTLTGQSYVNIPQSASFSPDGSRVALGANTDHAGILNTTTLDATAILKQPPLDNAATKNPVIPRSVSAVAWDAQGANLITATTFGAQYTVGMLNSWDVLTETRLFGLPFGVKRRSPSLSALAVTPDNRWIVAVTNENELKLWDRATGAEVHTTPNFGDCRSLAFSRDGRWLAANDGKIVKIVPTLAPRTEVGRFVGHRAPIHAIQFSPDDRWLATGSDDGTTLVWRVGDLPVPRQPIGELHVFKQRWAELSSPRASVVFSAQSQLLLAGDSILPTIASQLVPPPQRVDPATVARLIEQLDSDRFTEREAAFNALWRLAPWVRPALQTAATKGRSWEIKLRARRLLARLQREPAQFELTPTLGCIPVLEHLDTAESRRILESIAQWTTTDVEPAAARAALERLNRVPPVTPEPPRPVGPAKK